MNNWLSPIITILEGEQSDLRDLALSVGADPKFFYMNQDLSQCDLRGQDLRGMNLTGTKIHEMQCSVSTKMDKEFDPREYDTLITKKIGLSSTLYHLIQMYMERVNYVYIAPAIKSLVMRARHLALVQPDEFENLFSIISKNKTFNKVIYERPVKIVRINTTKRHNEIIKFEDIFHSTTTYYNIAILIALIMICGIDVYKDSVNVIAKIFDCLGRSKGLIPMHFEQDK